MSLLHMQMEIICRALALRQKSERAPLRTPAPKLERRSTPRSNKIFGVALRLRSCNRSALRSALHSRAPLRILRTVFQEKQR